MYTVIHLPMDTSEVIKHFPFALFATSHLNEEDHVINNGTGGEDDVHNFPGPKRLGIQVHKVADLFCVLQKQD